MCACFILEPLESIDQGQLASAQASAAGRAAPLALELKLSL
jgi:hypothetical protein